MSDRETVPIAYVTKWAATRGIIVYRDASISERGYLWTGFQSIPPREWTEDKASAEARWRMAVMKSAQNAEKKAAKLRASLTRAPKYVDRATREKGGG